MKKHFGKTLLAAVVGSMIFAGAQAQESTAAVEPMNEQQLDQVDQQIAAAASPQITDPGIKIEQLIEDFKDSPQGRAFSTNPGLFFTTASATVMVKPESREWGNARVMAYKEAMLKAQANYIRYLGLTVKTESLQRMFDDPSQMPAFSEADLRSNSKMGELLDKVVAVAGGKLDQQLTELGIDPDEFRAAPRERRATMFERSISQSTVSRGRADLTGIIPVKTFEAFSEAGDHVVAVAVVASPRFRQFIHDITLSKGDIAPDPTKAADRPLRDLLRENPQALIDDFGIRRMYDEQGYPVLISFGQSSNPYRGTDFQRRSDSRESSYIAARAESFANFAYLFNASGEVEEAVSQRAARNTTGVAIADGLNVTNSEEDSIEIMRAIESEIATRGNVSNLPGTRELMRWTQNHPLHGHEINGVVYIWHPQAEQQARDLRNFRPQQPSRDARAEQSAPQSTGQSGTSQSRDLMSADDF